MKSAYFEEHRAELLQRFRDDLVETGSILQTCGRLGWSYTTDYVGRLSRAERADLKAWVKRCRATGASNRRVRQLSTTSFFDRAASRAAVPVNGDGVGLADDLAEVSPVKLPFHADGGSVVCRQQVRLAVQGVVAHLDDEREFDHALTKELARLNDRGFITREQVGMLRFCLEGLKVSLRRIP